MGALTHNGEVLQSLPANASQINFDKTGTNLNSTQAENAIKEVNTKVNTNTADIAQLRSGLTSVIGNIVFKPESAPGTDPFDTNGTGYVMNIEYQGTLLGYLVIRPKGYVTDTGAHKALELYNTAWAPMWDVEYRVTN